MDHRTGSQGRQPSAVSARPFEPSDREFVMSAAPRLTMGTPSWRDREKLLAAVRKWLADTMDKHGEQAFVFIAQDAGGERLGFATVSRGEHFTGTPEAYLREMVVLEEAERRGVGSVLVNACIEWARAEGFPVLALSTSAANMSARRFYDQLGFREEEVRLVKLLS
ncbi:MAG: GNAT family N-acetyltransferase [Chloroflexia bacterium]